VSGWGVEMSIACCPRFKYSLPSKLYNFCKKMVAVYLWCMVSHVVIPCLHCASVEQVSPSYCCLLCNNCSQKWVLNWFVDHNGFSSVAELESVKEDFLDFVWYWVADEVLLQLFLVVYPVLLSVDVWTLEEMVLGFGMSAT